VCPAAIGVGRRGQGDPAGVGLFVEWDEHDLPARVALQLDQKVGERVGEDRDPRRASALAAFPVWSDSAALRTIAPSTGGLACRRRLIGWPRQENAQLSGDAAALAVSVLMAVGRWVLLPMPEEERSETMTTIRLRAIENAGLLQKSGNSQMQIDESPRDGERDALDGRACARGGTSCRRISAAAIFADCRILIASHRVHISSIAS